MNRVSGKLRRKLTGVAALLLILLFCFSAAKGQKYTFSHYDIENGLIQSQVNTLYQDNSHRLWMGTLGGACRFDGMDYYTISKASGLVNNFVYNVFCDKSGTVWFGTAMGLACLKNGQVQNFAIPAGAGSGSVNHLVQDGAGTIWGTISNHLFKVKNNKIQLEQVAGLPAVVTSTAINSEGKLFAAVRGAGIYSFNGKTWDVFVSLPKALSSIYAAKMIFDRQNPRRMFVQGIKYIFIAEDNTIKPYATQLLKSIRQSYLTLQQDASARLWIGTASGAYAIDSGKLIRFDAHNGFTDASVSDIYTDKENNLWLATQGSGLYRFDNNNYLVYDHADGVKTSPIVMGIAQDKQQQVLLGIDAWGVAKYDGQSIKTIWQPQTAPYARRVQCLFTDHTGITWIGTSYGGLWQYNGKQFTVIKGTENTTVDAITEDKKGMLWLGTPMGVYYYDPQKTLRSVGLNHFAASLLALDGDSLLVGTQDGVHLLVNKQLVPRFKINLLGSSAILSMISYRNMVIIGTDDAGFFVWNRTDGRVRNYQVKDGLLANSIYSLATDDYGLIWAGTGRGVNRFFIDPNTMGFKLMSTGGSVDRIVESNQNAILYHHHQIFVGTTKGLTVYNTALSRHLQTAPHIIISAIKLFAQDNLKAKLIDVPLHDKVISLSSRQNHLAINFLGVNLKNPENVTYQYRLTGLDDKFCAPVKNNAVDYPSLPPGRYTFEVRAINADRQVSKNVAGFSFEIEPPFYRTYLFQLGAILLVIIVIVIFQNVLHQRKIQKSWALEAMKREEKLKIRRQTAEDFHDDLGNKLTRITVLSDILDAKMGKDMPDQKNLVLQIKQNASALYNGTRDILWAMDPKSDNLYEVLNHIRETGIEIFQDTPIQFSFDGIAENQKAIKLPMEYSRNITMIFKELLNNVLKHAEAKHVNVTYTKQEDEHAILKLTDDGQGFDFALGKKGHGLNNVKARSERIGGQIKLNAAKGQGTTVQLLFNIYKKV